MILDAILNSTESDQVTDHATAQVKSLISIMEAGEYTLLELMQLLGLSHRATFQQNYLNPAIEAGFIKRTIPNKPKSPKQKYKLR